MKYKMIDSMKPTIYTCFLFAALIANFFLYLYIHFLNFGETKYALRIKFVDTIIILVASCLVMWLAEVLLCEFYVNIKYLIAYSVVISGIVILDMANSECISGFFASNRLTWELMIFIFPILLSQVINAYKENDENKILGAGLIFLWTSILSITTKQLPIAYLINLMLTNSILVIVAIWRYNNNNSKLNIKYSIGCVIAHVFLCIACLLANKEANENIMTYLYGTSGWEEYREKVVLLFQNVKLFGRAFPKDVPEVINELLFNSVNPVHTIILNYGLGAFALYIIVWVCMLVLLGGIILKYLNANGALYYVYVLAYVNILVRVMFGILYSCGVSPFQIELPCMGNIGSKIDWACIGTLLLAFSKYKEQIGNETLFSKVENRILNIMVKHLAEESIEEQEEDE